MTNYPRLIWSVITLKERLLLLTTVVLFVVTIIFAWERYIGAALATMGVNAGCQVWVVRSLRR